ncbi:hypothetical protein, partial [Escherichia coli]|uniref:hypothetical protein n=1 Tax=Escherichia coli TaxID=562 RepID=UPI0019639D59
IIVDLPSTDRIYVWAPFDMDTLSDELKEWLKDNITNKWMWSSYEPGGHTIFPRFKQTHASYIRFRFEDPNDAMLFKLTWA